MRERKRRKEERKGRRHQEEEIDERHKMGKERESEYFIRQWNTAKCFQKAH